MLKTYSDPWSSFAHPLPLNVLMRERFIMLELSFTDSCKGSEEAVVNGNIILPSILCCLKTVRFQTFGSLIN
jgi:hypothetical protein